jgi:hypothetical protein
MSVLLPILQVLCNYREYQEGELVGRLHTVIVLPSQWQYTYSLAGVRSGGRQDGYHLEPKETSNVLGYPYYNKPLQRICKVGVVTTHSPNRSICLRVSHTRSIPIIRKIAINLPIKYIRLQYIVNKVSS